MNQNNARVTIIVYGDYCSGKTNFCMRFAEDKYNPDTRGTFVIDTFFKNIIVDGKDIKTIINDTGNHDISFSTVIEYSKYCEIIFFVYDITNKSSFQRARQYLYAIQDRKTEKCVVYTLVGTKLDSENERQVETEEAKKFADEENLLFIEVSAKDNINVDEAFTNAISKWLKTKDENNQVENTENNENENKYEQYGSVDAFKIDFDDESNEIELDDIIE